VAGFDITSPTNSVLLRRTRDGNASGEASFAVANQTRHSVRAQALPSADAPTDPAWLEVDGAVERDFATGATESFIVAIIVPPEAAPGTYPFHLVVKSVALPDEEWGRGPVVMFQVPEPVELPPVVEEEPTGYLETVGGALMGAFAVAVVLLGVGLAIGIATASSGGTTTSTSGDFGQAISNIIGSAIGFAIVLVFFAIAFGGLGAWLGPVIGAFLMLRFRNFKEPWSTALPLLLLMPLLGLPILIVFSSIGNAVNLGGAIGAIWAVITGLVAVAGPALAARAFARWRQTGHV